MTSLHAGSALPHHTYVAAVAAALAAAGHPPLHAAADAPHGEYLEGRLQVTNADPDLWPRGAALSWAYGHPERHGWTLHEPGPGRHRLLAVDPFAAPDAVASAAAASLTGRPAPAIDQTWGGASALQAAVEEWSIATVEVPRA